MENTLIVRTKALVVLHIAKSLSNKVEWMDHILLVSGTEKGLVILTL